MNLIEKLFSLPFDMYILTILSNKMIYIRYLIEIKSRKRPYISDRYSGLPP